MVPENVLYSLKNQGERMLYVSDLLGKYLPACGHESIKI